jgi:catechol 2,3-dioxygenase-like lactoylglutathione lyase family enzyme
VRSLFADKQKVFFRTLAHYLFSIFSSIVISKNLKTKMTIDIGLTHIALPVANIEKSIKFYSDYAGMQVVHRRIDEKQGIAVAWLSDRTRPFVIVLLQTDSVHPILSPIAHLGIGCSSREQVDIICQKAREENLLIQEPQDYGYPVGYWAFVRDPDGHTLEFSYGQEVALTVETSTSEDI